MMSCLLSLISFIAFSSATGTSESNELDIHVCDGNSSLGIPLKNLMPVVNENVNQRITISLCPGTSLLMDDLHIFDQLEVNFIGRSNSILTCNSKFAGIKVTNVSSITVQNIKMVQCGSLHLFKSTKWIPTNFTSALFIFNSSAISILDSSISQSHGLGAVILDSYASTLVARSHFENNYQYSPYYGGGGLYIELKCDDSGKLCSSKSLNLTISQTIFRNNTAYYSTFASAKDSVLRFDSGGGLSLLFKGNTSSNIASITNCIFEQNRASQWGAGLNIAMTNSSQSNAITVEHSRFYKNVCIKKGGGGADIGYLFREVEVSPQYNKINFVNVTFDGNAAIFGGGILVYSTRADTTGLKNIESNSVVFENCTWIGNTARYAAALYLTFHNVRSFSRTGHLPQITLSDCNFTSNIVTNWLSSNNHDYRVRRRGRGTLFSIGYQITFKSSMHFFNNSGTALYLVFSTMKVSGDKNVITFTENCGYYGGAIALFGISIIHLNDNSSFNFTNNSASVQGGAIYQESIDNLEYITTKNCFVYSSLKKTRNVVFNFRNNMITKDSNYGHSIFIHSAYACNGVVDFRKLHYCNNDTMCMQYSGPVATLNFEDVTGTRKELSSGYARFNVKETGTGVLYPLIPGKVTGLPFEVTDDFGNMLSKLHQVTLETNKRSLIIDPAYTQTFFNNILLYGEPGSTGNLSFSLSSIKKEELVLSVQLQDCPPGYVYEVRGRHGKCICSVNTNKQYFGISSCNNTSFQAKLRRGYWLGYRNISSENTLLSSACPVNFCNNIDELALPNTSSSVQVLDELVCGQTRTGMLCAACRENYSTFYHSESLNCKPNCRCEWGWAFYLISEILPITIFFLLVILLDIQFTTGSIQGFVLYSQLFDTLLLFANGQNPIRKEAHNSLQLLKFFVNIFNLNFFIHDKLSFCLWKNASSLDILTFKYVTITYAFSLVMLTILALKYFRCSALQKLTGKVRNRTDNSSKTSLIHGLSGFLVICYSQCTKISLLILTPVRIFYTKSNMFTKAAFYDGRLPFLSGNHLFYALPAMIFTFTIVVLPPILLLSYPLCYKIFVLVKIQETKFTALLCKIIPLEKYKPFFDSFQSSFKDEHRYFSGLYFIYRLSTLVTFASTQNLILYYTLVEVQFIFMLGIHAWTQPYKNSWHNRLDGFLFATLAVVNIITLLRHVSYDHPDYFSEKSKLYFEIILILVAYLPILYMILYIARQMLLRGKSCLKSKNKSSVHGDENNLVVSLSEFDNRDNDEEELKSIYQKANLLSL